MILFFCNFVTLPFSLNEVGYL